MVLRVGEGVSARDRGSRLAWRGGGRGLAGGIRTGFGVFWWLDGLGVKSRRGEYLTLNHRRPW